jgi:hypothetical protein
MVNVILGTHMTSWAGLEYVPGTSVRLPNVLFYSVLRWWKRKRFPKLPPGRVILEDSGGYSALTRYGGYPFTPRQYLEFRKRQRDAWGSQLGWCASMDWMCEPEARMRTGLSVGEHQRRTVENWEELRSLGAEEEEVVPVLQGYEPGEHLKHLELYEQRGHDLRKAPVVGVGSICRRQGTDFVFELLEDLHAYGLKVHAFGMSTPGLRRCWPFVVSTDSTAWSLTARRERLLLPECRGSSQTEHRNCASCPRWAVAWHQRRLQQLFADVRRSANPMG